MVEYYDRIEDAQFMAFCEQCWPRGLGEEAEYSGGESECLSSSGESGGD